MGKIIDADDAIKAIRGLPRWILDSKGEFQPVEPPTKSMIDPDDAVTAIKNVPVVRSVMNPIEYAALNYRIGHKEGYEQGKADARREPKWIPVSERLPEVDVEVLVTLGDFETMTIGRMAPDEAWYVDFCEGECNDIVAWRQLPKPYTGRRKNGID